MGAVEDPRCEPVWNEDRDEYRCEVCDYTAWAADALRERTCPGKARAADPRVSVSNDELVSVRDAMRSLNRMVDALQEGRAGKFVLMRRGKMVAVVMPLPRED